MSLIIGMIVRNEAAMLPLTLPVMRNVPYLKLAVDFASDDNTVSILRNHGWLVIDGGSWRNDYGWARNELLAYGRAFASPGTWMLQLDADECITSVDLSLLVPALITVQQDVISFPRHNYAKRGTIREVGSYPDPQSRCIRLASKLTYSHIVHEVIDLPPSEIAYQPDIHIHHYGLCKPYPQTWLRQHNYSLILEGKAPSDASVVPESVRKLTDADFLREVLRAYRIEEYDGDHPLKGLL